MKKIENPVEVCVQFSEVGCNVLRAVVNSSLHLSSIDQAFFACSVLRGLVGNALKIYQLYDCSSFAVGSPECPFATLDCIPTSDNVIHLPASEFELQDGKMHKVSFTLNQSSNPRRDYTLNGVRFVRLIGVVSVEVDCDEEEA